MNFRTMIAFEDNSTVFTITSRIRHNGPIAYNNPREIHTGRLQNIVVQRYQVNFKQQLIFRKKTSNFIAGSKSSVMDSGDDLSSCGLLESAIVNEEAQLY